MAESRLVYSTDDGDLRKQGRPRQGSVSAIPVPGDGVVRVFRETSGRRGKVVTLVRGLPASDIVSVASELKRRCGTGGSVKSGAVEIQGDHRETVVARLREAGYVVKAAGG